MLIVINRTSGYLIPIAVVFAPAGAPPAFSVCYSSRAFVCAFMLTSTHLCGMCRTTSDAFNLNADFLQLLRLRTTHFYCSFMRFSSVSLPLFVAVTRPPVRSLVRFHILYCCCFLLFLIFTSSLRRCCAFVGHLIAYFVFTPTRVNKIW